MARRADPERESFWQDLVAQRTSSQLTVSELCRLAGVSPASFFAWQRRLRKHGPIRRSSAAIKGRSGPSLVPVRIVADQAEEVRMMPIVVELPGPVRVQIAAGCDVATIHAVFQAIAARFGGVSSC